MAISIFNSFVGEKNNPTLFESVGDWSNAFLVALPFEDKSATKVWDSNLTLFVEYLDAPKSGISNETLLSIASNWYGYDVTLVNPLALAYSEADALDEYNGIDKPFS